MNALKKVGRLSESMQGFQKLLPVFATAMITFSISIADHSYYIELLSIYV